MNTIYLEHPHQLKKQDLPSKVLALGYFDGVHLGHKRVILTARELANQKGYMSAVMTFHPHPAVVLSGKRETPAITPLPDKEKAIESLGIETLYIVRFDQTFSQLTPQQFIDQYIIGLSVKHVVAGYDFTYGRSGQGTMATIDRYSRGEFTHTTVEKVEKDGVKISSSLIRNLIEEGKVNMVPDFLGRHYQIKGTVVDGEKRGRTIGFPTANISPSSFYLLPRKGVYAVRVFTRGQWYNGILNLGYKPTFHRDLPEPTIEVHLIDFHQDIYGETVTLEWHTRIRDERKFHSIDDLVKQIQRDKEEVIHYFQLAF